MHLLILLLSYSTSAGDRTETWSSSETSKNPGLNPNCEFLTAWPPSPSRGRARRSMTHPHSQRKGAWQGMMRAVAGAAQPQVSIQ